MKNLIKLISVLMLVILMLFSVTACYDNTQPTVKFFTGKVKSEDSCELASNDNFTLRWDGEKVALLLESNKTGKIWCTTPYSFYQNDTGEGLASVALNSPINISYIEKSTLSVKTIIGATAVLKNGRVSSKKIKNGIRVTYFFDKIEVAVPVDYLLTDRGLEARVLVNGIVEGEYPVYKISLHPYMISAENNDTAYLTVPSGSGGIIYTKNGTVKDYSEEVYGEDPVRVSFADTTLVEETRLPIFGASNGEYGIMAVIGKGADSAMIEAHACDSEIGYSGAYVSFMLRGYDMTYFTDKAGQAKPVKKYSDNRLSAEYLSVGYYPLEDYSPDYVGMAAMYRDILKESGKSASEEKDAPTVAVDIMGGAESNKLFLGFPYSSLDVATTIKDVKKIAQELNDKTGDSFLIKLSGFGSSGLDTGAIGGGFKLSGKFGSQKDLKSLNSYCKEKGNVLAFDFDLMRYSNSKGGFSTATDSVQTANLITRKFQYFDVATNLPVKRGPQYFLLSPVRFMDAGEKLIKATNKMELHAVSLTTMGSLTYSDYSQKEYFCKGGNAETIKNVLGMVSKNKTKIVTADANIYAAMLSDFVTDVPNSSSRYDCINMDIPLYSMVLKGFTSLYSSSVNAANDPRLEFLKAMECGIGLNFSICNDVPSTLKSSVHSNLSASRYSSVKDDMLKYIDESKDYLNTVGNSGIVNHSKNEQLSHTVFSNGTEVYVNYGDNTVDTPFGQVEGRSFVYGKEAE